jgi:hypothetical protein
MTKAPLRVCTYLAMNIATPRMESGLLSSMVVMVIVTTPMAPGLLTWALRRGEAGTLA